MEAILEYIMEYYTWFLGGAIIILLAIIGYYADKTNFGQGKDKSETNKDDGLNLDKINENQTLGETVDKIYGNQENGVKQQQFANTKMEPIVSTANDAIIQQPEIDIVGQQSIPVQTLESEVNQEIDSNIQQELKTNFESEFEKFDKVFDEILPKKEIINDELLEEIDSLSLDKTQKLNLNDIPDLDDVDLPKIKTFEPEEKDVWKF